MLMQIFESLLAYTLNVIPCAEMLLLTKKVACANFDDSS